MTIPKTNCKNIAALKSYLADFEHTLESKPNGQSKYTFQDKLVLNLYETGSVVFQGMGASLPFAKQVNKFIDSINNAIPPIIEADT